MDSSKPPVIWCGTLYFALLHIVAFRKPNVTLDQALWHIGGIVQKQNWDWTVSHGAIWETRPAFLWEIG